MSGSGARPSDNAGIAWIGQSISALWEHSVLENPEPRSACNIIGRAFCWWACASEELSWDAFRLRRNISRDACSMQRKPQPLSSIDAAWSRQSGRDIKHLFLELADPHTNSAQSVQYRVWDCWPQLLKLTKVKLDLGSSTWKTASHYGGLGDLLAPIRMGVQRSGKLV